MPWLIVDEEPPMPPEWVKASARAAEQMAKEVDKIIYNDIVKSSKQGQEQKLEVQVSCNACGHKLKIEDFDEYSNCDNDEGEPYCEFSGYCPKCDYIMIRSRIDINDKRNKCINKDCELFDVELEQPKRWLKIIK